MSCMILYTVLDRQDEDISIPAKVQNFPQEIPQSSTASPQKTQSIPTLLLGLTHTISNFKFSCFSCIIAMVH